MKCFPKLLALCFWLLAAGFFFTAPIFAQEQVETNQKVSYTVLEDGTTKVKQDVELTNLTTTSYTSAYMLSFGFTDVSNIQAFDNKGSLETTVTPKDDTTQILFRFNDKVVGKGNILHFSLSYQTSQIARKNGNILEITIPKIKDTTNVVSYTASVFVPPSFGKPSYVKPQRTDEDGTFTFDKEDVVNGISIAFGEYQLMDYTLSYHLQNKRLYSVLVDIALPPTTGYQEVLLDKLQPTPQSVHMDSDGNWLATYRLEGSKKLTVQADGKVKIKNKPSKSEVLSKEQRTAYLKPQKYWQAKDPTIVEKAKTLKTVDAIYAFVVKTLTYDFRRVDKNLARNGAVSALADPTSAICMEFTDLFIALARAAGIPAREVDGFAYTRNEHLQPRSLLGETLHAWPQYYDDNMQQWISVDPTWENTSGIDYFHVFDYNHFAFVQKGYDSEYPSPAGTYTEGKVGTDNDVAVSFSITDNFDKKQSIDIGTNLQSKIVAGFSITSTIWLNNNGNSLFEPSELFISSDFLLPKSQKLTSPPIPPYGKGEILAKFKSPSFFDNAKTSVKATIQNRDFAYDITVSPLYLLYLPHAGGALVAIGLFFLAFKTRRLYLQRRKKSDSVRRKSK